MYKTSSKILLSLKNKEPDKTQMQLYRWKRIHPNAEEVTKSAKKTYT
jgi:hypothetical protein